MSCKCSLNVMRSLLPTGMLGVLSKICLNCVHILMHYSEKSNRQHGAHSYGLEWVATCGAICIYWSLLCERGTTQEKGFHMVWWGGGVNRAAAAAGGFYSSRSTPLHLFLSFPFLPSVKLHFQQVRPTGSLSNLCLLAVSPQNLRSLYCYTSPQLTSPPRSSPVAFLHPHSAPLCSLISCAWKIQPAVLIINKKARLKSAEATLLRQDPKDLWKELWSFLLSLYPVSFFFAVQKASRARPSRWRWNAEQLWEKKYNPSRFRVPQCDHFILYPCLLLMRNKWQVLQKLPAILQPNTHITTLTFVPASPETTCRPLPLHHAFITCRGDVAKTGSNIKVKGVRPSPAFCLFTAWFLYNV